MFTKNEIEELRVATLRDWKVVDIGDGLQRVYGQAFDIKQSNTNAYIEFDWIFTSQIEILNIKEGWVKTKNSIYKLVG